jgi:hypothetical protein
MPKSPLPPSRLPPRTVCPSVPGCPKPLIDSFLCATDFEASLSGERGLALCHQRSWLRGRSSLTVSSRVAPVGRH